VPEHQQEMPIEMPELNLWQKTVWQSGYKNWLLFAGRRKGKTTLAILRAIKVAWQGGHVAWCAADVAQGMAGWEELVTFVKVELLPYCTRKNFATERVISFMTGGSIRLVSAFDTTVKRKKGRGFAFHLLVFDEVQLIAQQFYKRIKPSILTTRGAIVMTGTPPETEEEYERAKWLRIWMDDVKAGRRPQGSWLIEESPTTADDVALAIQIDAGMMGENIDYMEAINIAKDFLQSEREDDPMGYAREYEVNWITEKGNLVYPEYGDKFVSDEYDFISDFPIYVCIDRGEGDADTVCLFAHAIPVMHGKRERITLRVFDEVVLGIVASEESFLEYVLREKPQYPLPSLWGYDIRAPGMGNALYNAGLPAWSRSVGVDSGIKRVRRLMLTNSFQVHPRCVTLDKTLRRYKRKPDGKPDDRSKIDTADALRYLTAMIENQHGVEQNESESVRELIEDLLKTSGQQSIGANGVYLVDFGI
jgi:hypothetical protein